MTQSESQRITPGTIAIILMGWLEIIVSVAMFVSELYVISLIFAIASVLLTFLSTQIRRPAWADRPRQPETASQSGGLTRSIMMITAVLAALSLGGAVWMLIQGETLMTVVMALWALSLGIQTARLNAVK
jgi:hypothetical protein